MTVVYVDSVFVLNALMDYLLVLCAARLAGIPLRRRRYLLAGLLGGAYAVAVFLPGLGFLSATPVKLAAGILLALAAYGGEAKLLRLTLLLLTVIDAARALSAALTPVHDLFIRLLNFHEFLFSLRGVRLAHVRIGVIPLAERSIGLLHLVVAGRRGYAQNLRRICHCLPVAFLFSAALSKRSHMPE